MRDDQQVIQPYDRSFNLLAIRPTYQECLPEGTCRCNTIPSSVNLESLNVLEQISERRENLLSVTTHLFEFGFSKQRMTPGREGKQPACGTCCVPLAFHSSALCAETENHCKSSSEPVGGVVRSQQLEKTSIQKQTWMQQEKGTNVHEFLTKQMLVVDPFGYSLRFSGSKLSVLLCHQGS